jgi:hypothetical protein
MGNELKAECRIDQATNVKPTRKSIGRELTIAAPAAPRHGQIIDLMQALKHSSKGHPFEGRSRGTDIPVGNFSCSLFQLRDP